MADTRTQLNIKIDHKTHWLASLAARYWGMTLAEFVESLIARGISREAMLCDEPRVQEPTKPSDRAVPFHDVLWSDDEATRLFNLATMAHELLSDPQRRTWAKITASLATSGQPLTLKAFCHYFQRIHEAN
jgi:hypothetical protein